MHFLPHNWEIEGCFFLRFILNIRNKMKTNVEEKWCYELNKSWRVKTHYCNEIIEECISCVIVFITDSRDSRVKESSYIMLM